MKNCTVYFEDNGQDFLEFDIVNHRVVACRPSQGWVWEGKKAVEVRDEYLWILMRQEDGTLVVTNITHKVVKVVEHEVSETETYPVNPKQVVMRPVTGSLVDFGQQLYVVNDAWITHTQDKLNKSVISLNDKCEGDLPYQDKFLNLSQDVINVKEAMLEAGCQRADFLTMFAEFKKMVTEQGVLTALQAKRYRALRQAAITNDTEFLGKASGHIMAHQGKGGTISEAVYDAGLDAAIAAKEKGYGNQN